MVDTLNKRNDSLTSASLANGDKRILAKDSEIRTTASNCLKINKN